MSCNKCLKDIDHENQNSVTCITCNKIFHAICANYKTKKSQWRCDSCKASGTTDPDTRTADLLTQMSEKLNKLDCLEKVSTDIAELKSQLAIIKNDLTETKDNIKGSLRNLTQDVNEVKEDTQHIKSDVDALKNQVLALQQRSRINNIEITNFPATLNEDTSKLVLQIAKVINFPLTADNIIACHRVPTRIAGKPANIIAHLRDKKMRADFVKAYKQYSKKFNFKKPTSSDIFKGGNNQRFYINEHLIPENKLLFGQTRSKAKACGFKHIWHADGTIHARVSDKSKIFTINTAADLDLITNQRQSLRPHSPSEPTTNQEYESRPHSLLSPFSE